MTIERRWLKVSEVASLLGLHPKHVYRLCRVRRILPFVKTPGIGIRIDLKELTTLLENKELKPINGMAETQSRGQR